MKTKLDEMLERYPTRSLLEKENALKEVSQEIILYGLSRTNFFSKAAMYGGTAMRLFLGLDRFSEDLDFVLVNKDSSFSWNDYSSFIARALESFGLKGEVIIKEKTVETGVSTAFFAEPTRETLVSIYPNDPSSSKIVFNQKTKIKFEVALEPNEKANYQIDYLEYPTSFGVKVLDPSSLFAGKISAILYRDWKSRSKGRDFYDFAFYVRKGIKPNLPYLEEIIKKKERINETIDSAYVLSRLEKRFSEIDFEQAKKDVLPFISDQTRLDVWDASYFTLLAQKAFEKVN
jgi:predicted nucleotidyltransferase component of viral defense system